MSLPLIGILVSTGFVLVFSGIFRYEKNNNVRFLLGLRTRLDAAVVYLGAKATFLFKHLGRDIFRQSIHYFFHSVLSGLLMFLRRLEKRVQVVLRSNKVIAKKSSEARTTRNKLDEIAEHKLSIALTEDEKRAHKDKMLEG